VGQRAGRVTGSHPTGEHEIQNKFSEAPAAWKRISDYSKHYLDLLTREFDHELEGMLDRLGKWSRKRLGDVGLALFDLNARTAGWLYNERIIKLQSSQGGNLPDHQFGHGDMVRLSRGRPLENWVDGVVLDRNRKGIRVVVSEEPKGIREGTWRLDRGANRVAHDRMCGAVNSFSLPDNEPTPLRDLILGGLHDPRTSASISNQNHPLDWPELTHLNPSQQNAAKAGQNERMLLIQGPPGTGKTTTAVSLLCGWSSARNGAILAVAESNVGVDNLLSGLLSSGIKAIRIGQPVKVRAELREATIDARMQDHPLHKELLDEQQALDSFTRKSRAFRGKEKGIAHRDMRRMAKELRILERRMRDDIIEDAEVICATCIGAGHHILDGLRFDRVLIDEASQATEPSSLVPIVRGARQLVLVGDHHQLPPTVLDSHAEEEGLGRSLFARLIEAGHTPHLLDEQYRMHPAISEFPSKRFYEGKIKNGIQADDRPPATGFLWPDWDNPVAFVPVRGEESAAGDGESKANRDEAALAVEIVRNIFAGGEIKPKDLGIISPYNGQVRMLRDMLNIEWLDEGLEVRSVDGYQGREKEIIVFSAVRANPEGKIGFLSDWRRLNVAITRAKRGLIVLGDISTLRSDPTWAAWIAWAQESGYEAAHIRM